MPMPRSAIILFSSAPGCMKKTGRRPSAMRRPRSRTVRLAWLGEADPAIEWAERGLRLSPIDPWRSSAFCAASFANFHLGRYEEATAAARKAAQASPAFSMCYLSLAAALAKLGRMDEAMAAARRVLELQPAFRYCQQFAGLNCVPELRVSMSEALRAAGLPE